MNAAQTSAYGAFEQDTQYTTHLVINHTSLELTHQRNNNGTTRTFLSIHAHPMSLLLYCTPTECRTLAAALKQLADDHEASAAQAARQIAEPSEAHGCCIEDEVRTS